MADLKVEFCGLQFRNPILVASIEPTNSLDNLKKCIDAGAAGAIVKTLTDMPAMAALTRHSKYAILDEAGRIIKGKVPRHYTFYSRSGYSSAMYDEWTPALSEAGAYAERNGAHIIASIGAGSQEAWVAISKTVEDCGVKMVELNLGCPHPTQMKEGAKTGVLICQDPEAAAEVTGLVVNGVHIPVMVKLSPEVSNLTVIARSVMSAGAAAVTVNSRFTGFAVDIETATPYIGGPAGVGGPWVKYITLRWVHDIYSKLGIPIAGSNGMFDWRDAVEFIMSGARVMQIGSVLMLKGHGWLGKVIEGLETFLDEHGYPDVDAIYGLASRRAAASYNDTFRAETMKAVIDDQRCTRCWNCVQSCFYDALSRGDDQVIAHPENCIGCELCFNVCPFEAVSYAPKGASGG